MRVWTLVVLTVGIALSGCAETTVMEPMAADETSSDETAPVQDLTSFVANLTTNASVAAGAMFNVSIDSSLPIADATNATWVVSIFNGTFAAVADNATTNATANNGTADDHAAAQANTTAAPAAFTFNGTGVPASFTLNLTEAGNHTIFLSVEAAGYESANAEAIVEIIAEAEEEVIPQVEQTVSGGWDLDDPACLGGPEFLAAGLTYFAFDIDPATWGQHFMAEYSGGFLTDYLRFVDADGATIVEMADTDGGEYYEIKSTVPAGAVEAFAYSCGGPADFDYKTPSSP